MNSNRNPYVMLGLGAAGGMLLGRFGPVLLANASGVRALLDQARTAQLSRKIRQEEALIV